MTENQAAKHYLRDITGTLDLPDFDTLIKNEGLLGLLPDNVAKYAKELQDKEDEGVHSYLCNIDKAPDSCKVNKAIAGRDIGRNVGYVQW